MTNLGIINLFTSIPLLTDYRADLPQIKEFLVIVFDNCDRCLSKSAISQ
ncbi:hypothetical protein [Nostoc sp. NIES-3756]|nr:hypothetical protein [Nostoc sp. NIES-3756]